MLTDGAVRQFSGIYVYLTLPYYHCDYHSVFTQNNKIKHTLSNWVNCVHQNPWWGWDVRAAEAVLTGSPRHCQQLSQQLSLPRHLARLDWYVHFARCLLHFGLVIVLLVIHCVSDMKIVWWLGILLPGSSTGECGLLPKYYDHRMKCRCSRLHCLASIFPPAALC